jgi:hypothetical protein
MLPDTALSKHPTFGKTARTAADACVVSGYCPVCAGPGAAKSSTDAAQSFALFLPQL